MYVPPVVIALHGIRTPGRWQKTLAEVLGDHHIPFRLFDYGYFSLPRFLSGGARRKMVDRFYEYYQGVVRDRGLKIDPADYCARPSVVAHSFGTYIAARAVFKYEGIRFDKLLLCGSILPPDLDWSPLFARDQVGSVRNECGQQDAWTGLVGKFIPDTGDSGRNGFHYVGARFSQQHFEMFDHSDYFHRNHMEMSWLRFLQAEPSSLRVLHGRELTDATARKRLRECYRVDRQSFRGTPHYSEVDVTLEHSLSWISVNPDNYTFLVDRASDVVKGYLNAMPLEDSWFEKICSGEIDDSQIPPEAIRPFGVDDSVSLYVMSIAVDPRTRTLSNGLYQEGLELLIQGLVEKIRWYAVERRIRVKNIAAIGWTTAGRKLCQMFGMEEISKDRFGNPVYFLDLADMPKSVKHWWNRGMVMQTK